ncbi:CDP-diacylglycerol--serine O-phosphatidyltransferase [Alginatibacterium sediminis]|uniref:CDP-diacylglycerol--serine O-phosphatidyltransferase n=1 Tax=Alginatibacterium sediminis TaxID=2164068 RepID=A0A420EFU4_9ALTE|nr:CDP-diacylglycerol--serine O-phosphatidyltransferase [Alginatibacterium sediminis]
MLDELKGISLAPDSLRCLLGAKSFQAELFKALSHAQTSVLICALYLEDDEAGRALIDALIARKTIVPNLRIDIVVDDHRARRGLIGQKDSAGNIAMYQSRIPKQMGDFRVHGVSVKTRELLGVLHLKGFVIDNEVLYSGASINNIYLHQHERYRFDRYHLINSPALAQSMRELLYDNILADDSVRILSPLTDQSRASRQQVARFKSQLTRMRYQFDGVKSGLRVTPIIGFGRTRNPLNKCILDLIKQSHSSLRICTPYFNLPNAISRALSRHLRLGKSIQIIVGDKTASDFYIPEEERFSTIGALPYLYEQSLRKFAKRKQAYIDSGQLKIELWSDAGNSFHLKGISSDHNRHLLTGNNLNPRAWALDLENGLLIQDPNSEFKAMFDAEYQHILQHTQTLSHYSQIQTISTYPKPVSKILKRISRLNANLLLKRIL